MLLFSVVLKNASWIPMVKSLAEVAPLVTTGDCAQSKLVNAMGEGSFYIFQMEVLVQCYENPGTLRFLSSTIN